MLARNFFVSSEGRSGGFMITSDKTGMDINHVAFEGKYALDVAHNIVEQTVCYAAMRQGMQIAFASFAPTKQGFDLRTLLINKHYMDDKDVDVFLCALKKEPIFYAKPLQFSCDNLTKQASQQLHRQLFRNPTAASINVQLDEEKKLVFRAKL